VVAGWKQSSQIYWRGWRSPFRSSPPAGPATPATFWRFSPGQGPPPPWWLPLFTTGNTAWRNWKNTSGPAAVRYGSRP